MVKKDHMESSDYLSLFNKDWMSILQHGEKKKKKEKGQAI